MENFTRFGKFQDIEYKRFDVDQLKADALSLIEQFNNADSFDDADKIFLKIDDLMNDFSTVTTVCHIRNDIDKSNKFYDEEQAYYRSKMLELMTTSEELNKALLATPYRKDFEKKYGDIIYKQLDAQLRTESPIIADLSIKEGELVNEYSKIVAVKSCEFNGKTCNFYGLLKEMQSTDRQIRKAAMIAWSKMYEEVAPQIENIYAELVKLRCEQAKKLGFDSYIDMTYLRRNRFDYNEKDVAKFREQIRTIVTPLCDKLFKEQAKRLGVDKLKFYDEALVFPDGNADPIGTKEELIAITQKMYREMSKESGEFFDFMVEHYMFDLDSKPNKRLGGYCTIMPKYGAPFIFSNFNGTAADYGVLTHEAGHCFNMYLSMRYNPIGTLVGATAEVCEIHSMSMELFAIPWMKDYFGDNVKKAKYAHIVDALCTIPYLVSVDEFQHEVFHNPSMSTQDMRAVWKKIEQKYMPWRDYDGNEFLESGGYWMQKQHIFMYPFYYIDYALAQLNAFEFYGKDKANHQTAWADYVKLCRAGGSKTYLSLLADSNLTSPFSDGMVEKAINAIRDDIVY